MSNIYDEIYSKIDEMIKKNEEDTGCEWTDIAKSMAKSDSAINWGKSRCIGREWKYVDLSSYTGKDKDIIIECIAACAVIYVQNFAKRLGFIKC